MLALHGVADGVGELGEVGDHGAGLFLGTVLPERNKVIVLAVEKKSDVRGISGKRVVSGDGDDDGRFISKMGFGGKGNGRVGNAVCKLCDCVSGAGRDDKCVQKRLGTDRLDLRDGVQNFVTTDFLQTGAERVCGAEAGVGFETHVRHDGNDVGEDGVKLFERFEYGLIGAERAAHGKAENRLFHRTS